jgi:hypothetical protein
MLYSTRVRIFGTVSPPITHQRLCPIGDEAGAKTQAGNKELDFKGLIVLFQVARARSSVDKCESGLGLCHSMIG